jgi:hypothetical protein
MAMVVVTNSNSQLQWTERWDAGTGQYTRAAADGSVVEQRPLTDTEQVMVVDYDKAMTPPKPVRARITEAPFTGLAVMGGKIQLTFTWSVPFDDDTYGYDIALPPALVGKVAFTEVSKTASALVLSFQARIAAVGADTVIAMAYQV